jgi:hypothetical protein
MPDPTLPPASPPPVRVWRYVLETSEQEWIATVLLDSRGLLCVHSAYGGASHRFDAAGDDPRRFFARLTEDHHDYLAERLASCGRSAATLRKLVRVIFPRWRRVLRSELEDEQRRGLFTPDAPLPDPTHLPKDVIP